MGRFPKKPRLRTVPTEADWGDYKSDLDQNDAHQRFSGRTNEEMQRHFRSNPLALQGELLFMPEIPFRYYVLGFRDFVVTGDFAEGWASDATSCFLNLVAYKLENQPRYIMPIMPDLLPAIEHVARKQAAYDAAQDICGNSLEKLEHINALFEAQGGLDYSNQLKAFL